MKQLRVKLVEFFLSDAFPDSSGVFKSEAPVLNSQFVTLCQFLSLYLSYISLSHSPRSLSISLIQYSILLGWYYFDYEYTIYYILTVDISIENKTSFQHSIPNTCILSFLFLIHRFSISNQYHLLHPSQFSRFKSHAT